MTTFTLMVPTVMPGNAPGAVVPTPVSVTGNPTRASFTFTLAGPASTYGQATVLASVDGVTYDPIQVMAIEPFGPNTVTHDTRLNVAYVLYDAQLDNIAPGGNNAATVTMTV